MGFRIHNYQEGGQAGPSLCRRRGVGGLKVSPSPVGPKREASRPWAAGDKTASAFVGELPEWKW